MARQLVGFVLAGVRIPSPAPSIRVNFETMLHKQVLFCPIWYCSEKVIDVFVNAKSSQILEYLSIQLLFG